MSTIPASHFVLVNPEVLPAGGSAIDMIGLMLTNSGRVPLGPPISFGNTLAVQNYFGANSTEAALAANYFTSVLNSDVKPASLKCVEYNGSTARAAFLRGGSVAALGLTALQQITAGSFSIVVDGYTHSASGINLSGATSFSNAASTINSALNASEPTESTFTAKIGATAITASMGGHAGTCTTSGTVLTMGSLTNGYFSVGDVISGTDATNSLPAGCTILAQLTGTAGGGAGATFTISAAATPGDMGAATVTGTSSSLDATVVTGYISVGDTITGAGVPASTTVVSQTTGSPGSTGVYVLSCAHEGIASESMVALSNVLDVTVCASPTIAVGQTVVGSGVAAATIITSQISGTAGGVGFYRVSGAPQDVASESMTGAATAPAVTYDSISGGFLITSGITGVPSTVAAASGSSAAALLLTTATGAVLSQGAAATTASAFMTALKGVDTNWATFFTAFNPDASGNTQKLAFATWNGQQNDEFAYVCWDNDVAATQSGSTTCLGYLLTQASIDGTILIYDTALGPKAATISGWAASVDFNRLNGRSSLAYKTQSGLVPDVTDLTTAINLEANKYNFYGAVATARQAFQYFYPGLESGAFLWADSYINQIWLNTNLQLALIALLTNVKSIAFNQAGYALVEAACLDPINAALNSGIIRAGVTLSAAQVAEINGAAGRDVASTVQQRGWYLLVPDASPAVRAARGPLSPSLWYTDGQSVNTINLDSIEVQ